MPEANISTKKKIGYAIVVLGLATVLALSYFHVIEFKVDSARFCKENYYTGIGRCPAGVFPDPLDPNFTQLESQGEFGNNFPKH